MAANLTPQYMEAEAEFKKAQTNEERLVCLKKMFSLIPKHKASEKLQADLKTRMADIRDEIEKEKKSPKAKKGPSGKVPKQGAGQVILIGAPNTGKSSIVDKLTRATPEVAAYPFTTREPNIGMMEWEDVKVQLIDTPPITPDYLESYLSSMVQNADAALLVVGLDDDDAPFGVEAVIDRLAQTKTMLGEEPPPPEDDESGLPSNVKYTRTLLVANKMDAPDAADRLEIVRELIGDRFPVLEVSCEKPEDVEKLRNEIYKFLKVIRVYTKQPGKPADMTSPFTCREGSTLIEMAELVHRDFVDNLKSAKIWGTDVFDGQTVGREHVLHDKDVVELHV